VNLIVQGRHLEVTDALRGYAQQKIERLARYFNPIFKVEVTFEANKDATYQAKLIVHLPKNHTVVCTEREKTLTAALDLATEAVERRLSALKEKLRGKGDREKVTRRLMRADGAEPF
jgi:putative sigma-54 modulation protein